MKNEYFILLVILIVVSLVVIAASKIYGIFDGRRKRKKPEERALRLKEFGPQVPFHSLPNANVISKFTDSTGLRRFGFGDAVSGCFFRKGGLAMNLMEGNMGSIDFVIYEYSYSVGHPQTSITYWGTAILFQSDGLALPAFKWGWSFKWGLKRVKGVQPGTPLEAKEEAGFKQCPTCGSLDVRGGAMIEGGGIGEYCDVCKKSLYKMNEEKALKLLGLVSIHDLSGWTALASNTQLLLYQEKVPVPVEKYQEFMEKALKIFQMFQSASQTLNGRAW